jgi:hypothetical protein
MAVRGIAAALLLVTPIAYSAERGKVVLESSDARLVERFNWAKKQALAYVFSGDPVGDWYEAALPERSAFCMRDVSHQSTGAQILGLSAVTRNMLHKFAENISESKDWCTYWEIDKFNRPAPVDYKNDKEFWYNLPANFDLLNCCYRQYLWTGDAAYLNDPAFVNFYTRTVNDYVKRWDKDGDGIPESYRDYGHRGIGSYDEDLDVHVKVGADLVAAQVAAYRAYSEIQKSRRDAALAGAFSAKAEQLAAYYNQKWWDTANQRFYKSMLQDGSLHGQQNGAISELWFGVVEPGPKTESALDGMKGENIEVLSYFPEIAYRYGRNEFAYQMLMRLTDPGMKRREYPEVSFAVVGAIAEGLMGIRPDARTKTVETLSHLTPATEWAELKNVPVFDNEVSVRHIGASESRFTNQTGPALEWKASFRGRHALLSVDGRKRKASAATGAGGGAESFVVVPVKPGETVSVAIPSSIS